MELGSGVKVPFRPRRGGRQPLILQCELPPPFIVILLSDLRQNKDPKADDIENGVFESALENGVFKSYVEKGVFKCCRKRGI